MNKEEDLRLDLVSGNAVILAIGIIAAPGSLQSCKKSL